MKTFLKYLIPASAVMSLTGSVYATQTLYITDGAGIGGAVDLTTSTTGTAEESIIGVDGWSIVVATGTASPPAGSGGTAQFPSLTLDISASYKGTGGVGSTIDVYFGSDGFGPTSASFNAILSGQVTIGTGLGVSLGTWAISGSAVPSVADPIPAGATTLTYTGLVNPDPSGDYNSTLSGSVNMASYSLGEYISFTGSSATNGYSLTTSLTAVPEPSMPTLAIVAAAAGALGMMRRRR